MSRREEVLQAAKKIILSALQDINAEVYLFGSWARGEEKRTSDLDIAINYSKSLPPGLLAHINSLLEESTIPYRIELVDLTKANEALVKKVQQEGIIWRDCKKEL